MCSHALFASFYSTPHRCCTVEATDSVALVCRGITIVTGLNVKRPEALSEECLDDTEAAALQYAFRMWPECSTGNALISAAVDLALPVQPLVCQLAVEPSTMPAGLVLLHDGEVSVWTPLHNPAFVVLSLPGVIVPNDHSGSVAPQQLMLGV